MKLIGYDKLYHAVMDAALSSTDEDMIFDLMDNSVVDAVPVVRCRNCKHWNEETGWCDIHSHFQGSDGEFCHPWESNDWKVFPVYYFCADGERVAKTTRGDENGQA